MTAADVKVRQTGPLMDDVLRASSPVLSEPPPGSVVESEIARADLNAAQLAKRFGGTERASRMALLGILLAELQEVPFDDIAVLLDVRPRRLEEIMRGEIEVPPHRAKRWTEIAEMLHYLHRVLEPRVTAEWLHTAVPALDGRTPFESIKRGQGMKVLELARSYVDPAFS